MQTTETKKNQIILDVSFLRPFTSANRTIADSLLQQGEHNLNTFFHFHHIQDIRIKNILEQTNTLH